MDEFMPTWRSTVQSSDFLNFARGSVGSRAATGSAAQSHPPPALERPVRRWRLTRVESVAEWTMDPRHHVRRSRQKLSEVVNVVG